MRSVFVTFVFIDTFINDGEKFGWSTLTKWSMSG